MDRSEFDTYLTLFAVILAAVVLPPAAAVPVLTFLIGLLIGRRRQGSRAGEG